MTVKILGLFVTLSITAPLQHSAYMKLSTMNLRIRAVSKKPYSITMLNVLGWFATLSITISSIWDSVGPFPE
jgi:hypothetical protein